MFERFTDYARHSIVLAQEEARQLQHNYIGTEHVLLGLLAEDRGLAAKVAGGFGLTLDVCREDVLAIIGRGQQLLSTGHIPFTPRAKKCLELSLREALQLGHDYIGTEHLLLGIVREGQGVAAHILLRHAAGLSDVRAAVVGMLPTATAETQRRRLLRRLAGQRGGTVRLQPEQPPELRTTPAADTSLAEAARLAGADPLGSHHILLAALADPNTAAARALAELGVDLDRAREALRTADVTGSSDELPEEAGRRQMMITVTEDRLTLEASDLEIIQLGHAAADALGAAAGAASQPGDSGHAGEANDAGKPADAGKPGDAGKAGESAAPASAGRRAVIRGDGALSGSLGLVWQALHDSLDDIRRRATAAGETPAPAPTASSTSAGDAPAAPPAESAGD